MRKKIPSQHRTQAKNLYISHMKNAEPAFFCCKKGEEMNTTKKKPSIILIVLGALASAFLGYLIAGAWREGIEFNEFLDRFSVVCSYPLHDYYNEFTFRMIGYALLVYAVVIVMYYTSQRNFMPGKEYGTSKLADIKQVNRFLADKDEGRNRILSQNVRMSLDTRHTDGA